MLCTTEDSSRREQLWYGITHVYRTQTVQVGRQRKTAACGRSSGRSQQRYRVSDRKLPTAHTRISRCRSSADGCRTATSAESMARQTGFKRSSGYEPRHGMFCPYRAAMQFRQPLPHESINSRQARQEDLATFRDHHPAQPLHDENTILPLRV